MKDGLEGQTVNYLDWLKMKQEEKKLVFGLLETNVLSGGKTKWKTYRESMPSEARLVY